MVQFPRTIWRILYLEWAVTLFAVVGLILDLGTFFQIQICDKGDETPSTVLPVTNITNTSIATQSPVNQSCLEGGHKYSSLYGLFITMGVTLIVRFLLTLVLAAALRIGIYKWCRYWHTATQALTALSFFVFSIGFILYRFAFNSEENGRDWNWINPFNWITELVYRVFILHTFKKHLSHIKAEVGAATGEERTVIRGEEGDERV